MNLFMEFLQLTAYFHLTHIYCTTALCCIRFNRQWVYGSHALLSLSNHQPSLVLVCIETE